VRGFEVGGDDYLTKPFIHLRELLLRVAAICVAARGTSRKCELLFGGNRIDFQTYEAHAWDGSTHALTHKEAMIMKALADRVGSIVSARDPRPRVGYRCSRRRERSTLHRAPAQTLRAQPESRTLPHRTCVGYRFTPEPSPAAGERARALPAARLRGRPLGQLAVTCQ